MFNELFNGIFNEIDLLLIIEIITILLGAGWILYQIKKDKK